MLFVLYLVVLNSQQSWTNYQISNTMFPSNPYKHITIDKNGNKWIATQSNGILRFDGTNWDVIDTSNTPSLKSNMINHLFFDTRDDLWISTISGGLHRKLANGSWEIFDTATQCPANDVYFPSNDINCVTEDSLGNIYVATRNGFARMEYKKDDQVFHFLVFNRTVFPALPSNEITAVQIQEINPDNHHVWLGTTNGLVRVIAAKNTTGGSWEYSFSIYNTNNSPLTGNGITGIMIDNIGHKWISVYNWQQNEGGGVIKISSAEEIILPEDWTVFNTQLPSNNIRSMAYEVVADESTLHWFTTHNGIARFNGTDWSVFSTNTVPNLPTDDLYGIAVEGSLKWFGTHYNMMRFDNTNWVHFDYLSAGIPNNHIQSMAFNPENTLVKWIGTANGLTRFNGSNWRVYNVSNSLLPTNDIRSLVVDKTGFLWIGTSQFNNLGGGLVKLNVNNDAMTVYRTSDSPLPWNNITKIAVCSLDKKWIATLGGGLMSLQQVGTEDIWDRYSKNGQGLPSDNIHDVFISDEDYKWIGTDAGIAVLHNTNNLVIREYNINNSDLPSNNIRKIKQDREGYIWAVTANGLSKLVDDKWLLFNTTGLSNNAILDIDFDVDNIKWITTNQGLFRTNEVDWSVYNTSNTPELLSTNLTFISIEDVEIDEKIYSYKWFGSQNIGLTVFRNGQQEFANGSYISVMQHPFISNSLKITGVVNNFRVSDVRFQINNITRENSEIAHNMWLCEHLVDVDSNIRIAFRFTHAGGDSTLVRNINVSRMLNTGNPVDIGGGAYLDVLNNLDKEEWVMVDNSESFLSFPTLNNYFLDNLVLLASEGHIIQKRNINDVDWTTVYEKQTIVNSTEQYRLVKNTDILDFSLSNLRNYPNPFNPTTTIFFTLNMESDNVNVDIYDLRGRKVKTVFQGGLKPGEHRFVWDGLNQLDREVSSGVYFIRVKSDATTLNRRIVLMK